MAFGKKYLLLIWSPPTSESKKTSFFPPHFPKKESFWQHDDSLPLQAQKLQTWSMDDEPFLLVISVSGSNAYLSGNFRRHLSWICLFLVVQSTSLAASVVAIFCLCLYLAMTCLNTQPRFVSIALLTSGCPQMPEPAWMMQLDSTQLHFLQPPMDFDVPFEFELWDEFLRHYWNQIRPRWQPQCSPLNDKYKTIS